MDIKILVASHKQCDMPNDDIYLPMHVGKSLHPEIELGYQPDNEGENISLKNPYYSELTAVYWAWKNCEADYIGLVHYRRHFCLKRKKDDFSSILNSDEVAYLCSKSDMILPKRRNLYIETVYSHYDHTFTGDHFDKTRKIIEECYPEYLIAFDKQMKSKSEHLFNMFIMKRELFNAYCEWMFPILGELEKAYQLSNMDSFQARLIGRISERLLDVWINKNGIKYIEVDYIYFGKRNMHKKILGFIMAKFFRKKYVKSF